MFKSVKAEIHVGYIYNCSGVNMLEL